MGDKQEDMPAFIRRGIARIGVLIIPPGIDDSDLAVKGHTCIPLSEVASVVDENTEIYQIEELSWPGKKAQQHLLIPHPKTVAPWQPDMEEMAPTESGQDRTHPARQLIGNPEEAARHNEIIEPLVDKVTSILPESFGVAIVAANLRPLGQTALPTHRLLVGDREEVVSITRSGNPCLQQIITRLKSAEKPHVTQTIIGEDKRAHEYRVSCRIAVLDSDHAIRTRQDLFDHIVNNHQFQLNDIYENLNLESNFDFPIVDFHEMNGETEVLGGKVRKYAEWSDTKKARTIYKGYEEYHNLVKGVANSDDTYETYQGYPRMRMYAAALEHVLAVVPQYYEESIWTGSRDPIECHTYTVVQEPQGTDQDTDDGTDITTVDTDHLGPTAGSNGHETMLAWLVNALSEQGMSAHIVDQTGESVPDGVFHR